MNLADELEQLEELRVDIAKQNKTSVQSVLFDKDQWSVSEARSWLKEHDYKSDKVDTTDKYHRFRQFEPGLCKEDSEKTITLGKGIKAVICKKKKEIVMDETTGMSSVALQEVEVDNHEPQGTIRNFHPETEDAREYHEGVEQAMKSDEQFLITKSFACGEKAFNEKERTIQAYVSTVDKDRAGDIVRPRGAKLKNFRKNPVILWAHDYHSLPIAKALWAKADDHGVLMKIQFDDRPIGQEIFRMFTEGYLNAFSIGFMPIKSERITDKDKESGQEIFTGFDFLEWELYEASAVPVPANPNALIEAHKAGTLQNGELIKCFGDSCPNFKKYLDEQNKPKIAKGGEVVLTAEKLKNLIQFLKEADLEAGIRMSHEYQEVLEKYLETLNAKVDQMLDLLERLVGEDKSIPTDEALESSGGNGKDFDVSQIMDRVSQERAAGEIRRFKGKID